MAELSIDFMPYTVVTADFNGDGVPDFAVSGGTNSWTDNIAPGFLLVFLGNGDFTFQPLDRFALGFWSFSVAVADFDRDGIPDVASAGADSLTVARGKGDGTFTKPAASFGVSATPLAAADFDDDGTPDLLTAGGGAVFVLLNTGNGTFRRGQTLNALAQTGAAIVTDLNLDRNQDIVVARAEAVLVFHGNGDGTFAPSITLHRACRNFTVFACTRARQRWRMWMVTAFRTSLSPTRC